MGKLLYFGNRLKEPSSQAALAMLLQTMHVQYPAASWSMGVNILSILCGVMAVFIKEKG